MPVNENWSRWIFASTSKHFHDDLKSKDADILFFIEGLHNTIDIGDSNRFEYRQDGPYYTERTRGDWRVFIEINLLLQHAMNDTSFHGMRRMAGLAASAFTKTINVYRYGDGPDDDDSFLGCLILLQDARKRQRIQTSHFGQLDPKHEIEQATVEGHYHMFLNEQE